MPRFEAVEIKRTKKPVDLPPVRPNLGIEAAYRKKVLAVLREMHDSITYWITARYRQNEPFIAMDEKVVTRKGKTRDKATEADHGPVPAKGIGVRFAGGADQRWLAYIDGEMIRKSNGTGVTWASRDAAFKGAQSRIMKSSAKALVPADLPLPANELTRAMRALSRRWLKNFDELAPSLAKYFSLSVNQRTDAMLAQILKKGGFTVTFKMTRAMRDVVNATTAQNVGLIKSIPQKYLAEVEGAVMRSVQTGRDLGALTKELQDTFGVARRRAELIAKDQNNKATSAMNRARQTELGITTAKWRHSGGGRHPRPAHVAMNGKTYEVSKGMYDPVEKKFVFPGELINCRCISVSIIPGLG